MDTRCTHSGGSASQLAQSGVQRQPVGLAHSLRRSVQAWQPVWSAKTSSSSSPGTRTPDALVHKTVLYHFLGSIDIAQIDDYGLLHDGSQFRQVESPKLLPFGDEDKRIGIGRAGVGVLAILELGHLFLGLVHANRIKGMNNCTKIQESCDKRNGRRL